MNLRNPATYLLCVFLFAVSLPIQAASREGDIQSYIKTFSGGNPLVQTEAYQKLQWQGLSDGRIFDPIEKKLLDRYQTAGSKEDINLTSWMVRSLGFSGQAKYKATLEKVADGGGHKKIKKHAKGALEELPKYKKWNPIISRGAGSQSGKAGLHARFANMIKSDDLELKRLGAKRIHYDHVYDAVLLGTLNTEILNGYKKVTDDKLSYDSYAWMVKTLAGSRNLKYKSTVTEVAEKAPSEKLQKYAKKYLKYYETKAD